MAETETDRLRASQTQTTVGNSKNRLIDNVINMVLKVLIVAYIITWVVALT